MSNVTVTIAGSAVAIRETTLNIKKRVDDKDTCTFTLVDSTGTLAFSKGQTVSVDDNVLGNLFTGYINKPTATNLYPNATNLWSMDCVNKFYVAAKKSTTNTAKKKHRGGKHKNQQSGAIVANQIQEFLAPDGVTGNFGLDWSELQTDWQTGTQSGVVATTNTSTGNEGAGDLELNPGGTVFTYTNSASVATNQNILAMTGYASSGYTTAYTYRQIWTGSQIIASNDQFQYQVWVASSSPAIKAIADFVCSDGTVFSASTAVDQQNLSCAPTTDLSGLANDQWYSRSFTVPAALVGKTIVSVLVGITGANAGTYNVYFRFVQYFVNASATTVSFFGSNSTLSTNVQTANIGYTNVSLLQTTGGDKTQIISLSPGSFSVVGIVQLSQLSWVASLPSGCTALVETSIDSATSWQVATSGAAIPNLLPGMVAGVGFNNPFLNVRVTFTLGKDPTALASLANVNVTINPAYTSTKTDFTKTWLLSTDFNAGTLTNLIDAPAGEGITLNGVQATWDDGNLLTQTLYGTTSPAQTVVNKQMQLSTGTGTDVRSRLDFAGQWQNFTAEIDVSFPSANVQVGLVYRTTGWQNNNDTYAYMCIIQATAITLGRGTNSATGAGVFTSIQSVALSLANNAMHRLKLVVSGNTHKAYLDGVLLINATDATWTATGFIGLRMFNGTGSTQSAPFDNFGVCAALSGTWQSASTSISGPGTYGGSLVAWDIDNLPDTTTSISVQSSIDGGSTFQSVANGGVITGLIAGQSLAAKTLILLVTLAAQNASVVPDMAGISVWILGQYSSSGTRSTAPLAWDSATRINVASGFGTASGGQTYTQTGTGTTTLSGNELTIANTTGDVHMQLGSTTQQDTDGTCRFSLSASTITAGMELRYSNANTFYRLSVSTTTISIIKKAGPTVTLASVAMALSTGIFYRMRFVVSGSGVGSAVTLSGSVWLDGTTQPTTFTISTTD